MGVAASRVTVDEVIERINAAILARQRAGQTGATTAPPGDSRSQAQPLSWQPLSLRRELHPQPNSVYKVTDLLDHHDVVFIENAYRAVLGRQPDTMGMQPYLNRLRSGESSKVDILGRLRYSREGRRKRAVVRGLLPRFLLQQAYRIPIVGYGLEWLIDLARLPGIVRRIRRLEGHSVLLTNTAVEHANRSERALEARLDDLTRRVGLPESRDAGQTARASDGSR